jgi:hypothetical protein
MVFHLGILHWLVQAACGGSVILLVGCLAHRLCRQPAQRLRLIELRLLRCLLVPWLNQLPGLPHWSAGLLDESSSHAHSSARASLSVVTVAAIEGPALESWPESHTERAGPKLQAQPSPIAVALEAPVPVAVRPPT